MSFSDHKITKFTHTVSALPDQPSLPPADLKARFDSSPEELRQAHNAVCDDAQRLDDRVSGIVAQTFGDTIPKSMLSNELQAEIDAKADSSENAAAHAQLQNQIAQKCEVYIGSYTGDAAESGVIELGFTPKAVLIFNRYGQTCTGYNNYTYTGGLAITGHPSIGSEDKNAIEIVDGGFKVFYRHVANRESTVTNNGLHYFIALR